MPRYFFSLDVPGAGDPEGEELADDTAAIAEAQLIASDLSRERTFYKRILVMNEKNEIIHEEPIQDQGG